VCRKKLSSGSHKYPISIFINENNSISRLAAQHYRGLRLSMVAYFAENRTLGDVTTFGEGALHCFCSGRQKPQLRHCTTEWVSDPRWTGHSRGSQLQPLDQCHRRCILPCLIRHSRAAASHTSALWMHSVGQSLAGWTDGTSQPSRPPVCFLFLCRLWRSFWTDSRLQCTTSL